jgi:hypothetical protein
MVSPFKAVRAVAFSIPKGNNKAQNKFYLSFTLFNLSNRLSPNLAASLSTLG